MQNLFGSQLVKYFKACKTSITVVVTMVAALAVVGMPLTTPAWAGSDGPCLECDITAIQALFPEETEVTIASAVRVEDFTMPYCRVDGYVITHGPGDEDGLVNFMVALPDSFNNRYLFSALGGSAGYIHDPVTDEVYGYYHNTKGRLMEGYVIATTDTGSQTPGCEYGFAWNRTKGFDHDQRGVHVSAVATQAITRAYYCLDKQTVKKRGRKHCSKQKNLYRYIMGGSGGGRSGMVSAIHYPEDFDGYIVGWPGINVYNQLFFGKLADFIIKNTDLDLDYDPEGAWIPPESLQLLEDAVLEEFDGTDGVIDGQIWDHTKIDFDPACLKDPNGDSVFNVRQLNTLQIMMNGLKFCGEQYYPGFPLTNPSGWSPLLIGYFPPEPGVLPGVLQCFNTSSKGIYGPDYDFLAEFNFANPDDYFDWAEGYRDTFPGSGTQEPAELEAVKEIGGKMVIFHGLSDNAISVNDSIRFYDELAELQHGYRRTQRFARLFLAPGVFHGGGGPGPAANDIYEQALAAMIQWVENGKAPRKLVPHSVPGTTPERTFLLCPYPKVSVFLGGDVNDASCWTCRNQSKDRKGGCK